MKEIKVLRIVGLMLVAMFQEARDDVRDAGGLVCLAVVTSVRWKQSMNAAKPVLCS